jgi:hypothetical protein
MTYAIARAIVGSDEAYTITVDLVSELLKRRGVATENQKIVQELIMSAIAAAFAEGTRHGGGVQ